MTKAMDKKTGTQTGVVADSDTIIDTVTCTNLIVGKKYTLSGTLHYKKTFTDANGNKHEKGDKISATLVKATAGGKSLTIKNNEAAFKATKKNMTVTLVKTAGGELFTAIKTFKAGATGKGTVKLEYNEDRLHVRRLEHGRGR